MPTLTYDVSGTFFLIFVSIIRRCVGTCRLAWSPWDNSEPAVEFQSSEDVWGHADNWAEAEKQAGYINTFQSSEDVWGHADTDEMELYARATAEFQSSEDVWGHAD